MLDALDNNNKKGSIMICFTRYIGHPNKVDDGMWFFLIEGKRYSCKRADIKSTLGRVTNEFDRLFIVFDGSRVKKYDNLTHDLPQMFCSYILSLTNWLHSPDDQCVLDFEDTILQAVRGGLHVTDMADRLGTMAELYDWHSETAFD